MFMLRIYSSFMLLAREDPVFTQRRHVRSRDFPRARRHCRNSSCLRRAGVARRDIRRIEIEKISKVNTLTGEVIADLQKAAIYPAKHFVTSRPTIQRAVELIRAELADRLSELRNTGKLLEDAASRIAHEFRHRDDMLE